MKKLFALTLLFVTYSLTASAFELNAKDKQTYQGNAPLRDQMDKMILSVADMDLMINRDREIDYDILKEDAERILKTIAAIRALDKERLLKKPLDQLESPTKAMLKYSQKRDPRVAKYPEKVFNACFQCHANHRQW